MLLLLPQIFKKIIKQNGLVKEFLHLKINQASSLSRATRWSAKGSKASAAATTAEITSVTTRSKSGTH